MARFAPPDEDGSDTRKCRLAAELDELREIRWHLISDIEDEWGDVEAHKRRLEEVEQKIMELEMELDDELF